MSQSKLSTKNSGLTLLRKRFNSEVLKLSWVYLIIFSLVTLGLVQLYTTTTRTNPQNDKTRQSVESLQQQLNEQKQLIDQLKHDIQQLKNSASK